MNGGTLELEVHPDDLRRLLRHPALRTEPGNRRPAVACTLTWHDTGSWTLARQGLALAETGAGWRLERLGRGEAHGLVGEADSRETLGLEGEYRALGRFVGRDRGIHLGAVELVLRSGVLRVGPTEQPCHRLILSGPPSAVCALAESLAADLRVRVPAENLAESAIGLAGGELPARPLDAPEVRRGSTVADAFAHIAAQLADTIRHWSERIGSEASPEPVHQARVAVRRLRSALSLFRGAIAGPAIDRIGGELRELASRLGAARDWDVFLAETAAPVQAAFTGDRRLARLGSSAARQRGSAYAALAAHLESPGFRVLGIALAGLGTLRGWAEDADPARAALLAEDVTTFAARLLAERRRKLLKPGKKIADLPPERLHGLRKRAKKLRYGCEFFGTLFPKPAKRTLRRLARLQESLGHLNDGATAAALLAELGGGRARSFASGAVQGFTVARGNDLRAEIQKNWTKFRREPPFWEK